MKLDSIIQPLPEIANATGSGQHSAPTLDKISGIPSYHRENIAVLCNTCTDNSLDLCAIIRLVELDTSGIPVGLHVMGENGKNEKLVCIASYIESLIEIWAERIGSTLNVSS